MQQREKNIIMTVTVFGKKGLIHATYLFEFEFAVCVFVYQNYTCTLCKRPDSYWAWSAFTTYNLIHNVILKVPSNAT